MTIQASLMEEDLQKSLNQIRKEIAAGKFSGKKKKRTKVHSHLQEPMRRKSTKWSARVRPEGLKYKNKTTTAVHMARSEWFSKPPRDSISTVPGPIYKSFSDFHRAVKSCWPAVSVGTSERPKDEDEVIRWRGTQGEVKWGPTNSERKTDAAPWFSKYSIKSPKHMREPNESAHKFNFSPPSFNSYSELSKHLNSLPPRAPELQEHPPQVSKYITSEERPLIICPVQQSTETQSQPDPTPLSSTQLLTSVFNLKPMDPPYQPLPVVNVHPDEVIENAALWQFALVGFLFGAIPAFSLLRGSLPQMWNVQCSIHAMRRNIFMINFLTAADRNRVECEGPWVFHGCLIFLTRWRRELNVDYVSITRIPSWIRITGAPMEYWNQRTLYRMASVVGEVILISPRTTSFCNTDFIEACVYINLLEPLLNHFHMNCNGRVRLLTILYQGNHHVCIECGGLEHSFLNCNRPPLWYISEETDTEMEDDAESAEPFEATPEVDLDITIEEQGEEHNQMIETTMNTSVENEEEEPTYIPGIGQIDPATLVEVPVREIGGRPLTDNEILNTDLQQDESRIGRLNVMEADDMLRCEEMMDLENWAQELEDAADLVPTNGGLQTTSGSIFRAPTPPDSPTESAPGSPRQSHESSSFRMYVPSPCESEASSPTLRSLVHTDVADLLESASSKLRQRTEISLVEEVNDNIYGAYGRSNEETDQFDTVHKPTNIMANQHHPPLANIRLKVGQPSSTDPSSSKKRTPTKAMESEEGRQMVHKKIDLGLRLGSEPTQQELNRRELTQHTQQSNSGYPEEDSAERARIASERKRKGKEPAVEDEESPRDREKRRAPEPLRIRSFEEGRGFDTQTRTNEFSVAIDTLERGIRKIRRIYDTLHDGVVFLPVQPGEFLNLLPAEQTGNQNSQPDGATQEEEAQPAKNKKNKNKKPGGGGKPGGGRK